jgi:glyoxylase I family protein
MEDDDVSGVPGVHHIGLVVRDLERSLEFYGQMFGVAPEFTADASGDEVSEALGVPNASLRFAFLRLKNVDLELLSYGNPRKESFDLRGCDVGASHVAIEVDDIDAMCAAMAEKGVQFFAKPLRIDGGPLDGCKFVYFRDPDGIILELFEARLSTDRAG